MRVNHMKALVLGLSLVAASGCSTAPTAVPAAPAPAPVVHPVQQLEPAGGLPVAPAPLAADPCNPCDGIGGYGPYGGAPYYPYTGIPLPGLSVGFVDTFFDPFFVNDVVVREDVRPSSVVRDSSINITGDNNTVIIKQGGRGGGRVDGMDVNIEGDGNVVKVKQGGDRKNKRDHA